MSFDREFWDRQLKRHGIALESRQTDIPNSLTTGRIIIPLASKPADYVPGSGPPLQPISLLPPGGSAAYIDGRCVISSFDSSPNGKPPSKRMVYLIKGPGIPEGKQVPANRILDFVSPRALETFEEQLEQAEAERLERGFRPPLVKGQKKKSKTPTLPARRQIGSAIIGESVTVARSRPGPASSRFALLPTAAGQGRRRHPTDAANTEGKTSQRVPATTKPNKWGKAPKYWDENLAAKARNDEYWVVDRIEAVQYCEMDGCVLRYFMVNWEGDWPPGQKRTWEPEENIPENLVLNFLKTPKSKRVITPQPGRGWSVLKQRGSSRQGLWKRRLTSGSLRGE
ncbi:chromo domain [Trichoderma arundinaceum]|uniref:Chromo domain n=1 Tax=Trichoderma arundinaceum TaxID=490622 RepID=A0A395N6U8_TRIAR|nr:chromo domain [Trichoderma arundinaceum]